MRRINHGAVVLEKDHGAVELLEKDHGAVLLLEKNHGAVELLEKECGAGGGLVAPAVNTG